MPEQAIASGVLPQVNPIRKRVSRLHASISWVAIFGAQFQSQSAARGRSSRHKLHCSCLRPHATTGRETHHSTTRALAALPDRLLSSFLM